MSIVRLCIVSKVFHKNWSLTCSAGHCWHTSRNFALVVVANINQKVASKLKKKINKRFCSIFPDGVEEKKTLKNSKKILLYSFNSVSWFEMTVEVMVFLLWLNSKAPSVRSNCVIRSLWNSTHSKVLLSF